MKYCIYLWLLLSIAVNSCTKSIQEEAKLECSLVGTFKNETWCGQVFEIFLDDQDNLVINASRDLNINDSNIDQITIYVPEFVGEGTYKLQAEGGVYREWCCSDMLLEILILDASVNDSGEVVIETYNEQTGEIRGSFDFTAEQIPISGNFSGTKE